MRLIQTIFLKEVRSEWRARSGLLTAGMFSIVTVIAIALGGFGKTISGGLASGMIWVALLFAAVVSVPRSFVTEEEQGTGDLLRMIAPPYAVFWGKALFNFLLMAVTGFVLSIVYVNMAGVHVMRWDAFLISIIGGCAALSGTVTLCGALVAQASHRGLLAGAISLPLLIPFVFLGVAALRLAFGEVNSVNGWSAVAGVWMYAIASFAIGPVWFEAVWKA